MKVPYNEARYGRSNGYPCAGNVCSNTHALIPDALVAWTADQKAKGRTDAQIKKDLASFDQWDRYDFDGDGNFNEPDGYIDHFQIVHAGGDQADGDERRARTPSGATAGTPSRTPPGPGGEQGGGAPVGNTGLWVGDYTIQPENGGSNVFAHEYGHDLGLPDEYDSAGGPPERGELVDADGPEPGRRQGDQGIGPHGADLGAWDKLQLGWLDYETVVAGQNKNGRPRPARVQQRQGAGRRRGAAQEADHDPARPAGRRHEVVVEHSGDDLNTTLTRSVTLPAGAPGQPDVPGQLGHRGLRPGRVRLRVRRGRRRLRLQGDPRLDHQAGRGQRHRRRTAGLEAGDVRPVGLRRQDGRRCGSTTRPTAAAGGKGFFADEIKVTSGTTTVFTDGAENGANGWTVDGFRPLAPRSPSPTTSSTSPPTGRTRRTTSTCRPVRTTSGSRKPDWVEHFPYQDGLLVCYWDTS